jgi:hypothetical protein
MKLDIDSWTVSPLGNAARSSPCKSHGGLFLARNSALSSQHSSLKTVKGRITLHFPMCSGAHCPGTMDHPRSRDDLLVNPKSQFMEGRLRSLLSCPMIFVSLKKTVDDTSTDVLQAVPGNSLFREIPAMAGLSARPPEGRHGLLGLGLPNRHRRRTE